MTDDGIVDVFAADGSYLGAHRVVDDAGGAARLEAVPEPTVHEVRAAAGHRAMTAAEFECVFGPPALGSPPPR